jgi:ClpP class serine protease
MSAEEIKKIESIYSRPIDATAVKEIKALEHIPRDTSVDSNGVGNIEISGVLTPKPDPILSWWGVDYTAYSDIVTQVNALEGDKSVKGITLNINSPGGNIEGLYSAMGTIADTDKPIITKASGNLASAAYMLGSQSDNISASNDMDIIGSNGVVIDHFVSENFVSVTNTKSEKKRNDVTTPEGIKNEKAELDDIYNVLVEKIAEGRGITVDKVNSDYGQGAVMTARTALKNGMIDGIGFSSAAKDNNINNKTKTSGFSGQKKECKMETLTLAELKAQHPDLYASCFNTGVEAGKEEFKLLACGHLELAAMSGEMDRAAEDIKAGNEMTPAIAMHHNIQGMKKAQMDARGAEAPESVGEGDSPIESAHDGDNEKDAKEAKSIFAEMGVEVE